MCECVSVCVCVGGRTVVARAWRQAAATGYCGHLVVASALEQSPAVFTLQLGGSFPTNTSWDSKRAVSARGVLVVLYARGVVVLKFHFTTCIRIFNIKLMHTGSTVYDIRIQYMCTVQYKYSTGTVQYYIGIQ